MVCPNFPHLPFGQTDAEARRGARSKAKSKPQRNFDGEATAGGQQEDMDGYRW